MISKDVFLISKDVNADELARLVFLTDPDQGCHIVYLIITIDGGQVQRGRLELFVTMYYARRSRIFFFFFQTSDRFQRNNYSGQFSKFLP